LNVRSQKQRGLGRSTILAVAVAVLVLVLAACRSIIDYEDGLELAPDADAGDRDVRSDAGVAADVDAARDAAVDATVDATLDATLDAALDAAVDAAVDGSAGGESCVGVDAGSSGTARSCNDLPSTCGPDGTQDCCASTLVPAGSYYRRNDGVDTATVSSFYLDTYEVSVGRFRKFVDAYSAGMITPCAGRNPNNPDDLGWSAAWNAQLPADQDALKVALKCGFDPTWTAVVSINENRPMNCVTWYEAEAFCMWDNGRLPTNAEWTYAAVGGLEQRTYPWGFVEPGSDAKLAVYDCLYGSKPGTCSIDSIAIVGSVSAGNAKWGQANMAGNVWEWVQDWEGNDLGDCTDCANLDAGTNRLSRGGDYSVLAAALRGIRFDSDAPLTRSDGLGLRCARAL
jgi:formylglycine-generating enzyme